VESRFGVPAEIVVAVWGMETAYGAIKGDQDVIRSLATLAAQGRRRAWAETQLISAARIIMAGEASRSQLRGSWAGAMGHTQFIPETYLSRAVDGNGDGRRDVRRADGRPWNSVDADSEARLILPAGARGPAFLTFPNHMAIRAYNNSTSYALAVGLIADGLRGAEPLRTPWPIEQPLSIADRRAAQAALTQLGFNVGAIDGVIGAGTRAAVRAWQQSRGRPADGYVDAGTIAALRREAGI
jgi:membrane-bound lytic murein transglycosylase B